MQQVCGWQTRSLLIVMILKLELICEFCLILHHHRHQMQIEAEEEDNPNSTSSD